MFLVLGYTVLALFAQHLPPGWESGVALLVPLIGVVVAVWLFAPSHRQ